MLNNCTPEYRALSTDKTDSTALAQDRTDWAEDRTVQANERTFAGWMRTGLASVGVGIAIHAIYGKVNMAWLAKSASTLFICIGIGIFLIAYNTAKKLLERLDANDAEPIPRSNMLMICGALSTASLVLIGILWII